MKSQTQMQQIAPQPLDLGQESLDDYDELLFFLLTGQNSSSSFASKSNTTSHKVDTELESMQLKVESLRACQKRLHKKNRKDTVNKNSRAGTQAPHLADFSNLTSGNEYAHEPMLQDFLQMPTAVPTTLNHLLYSDQQNISADTSALIEVDFTSL